MPIVLQGDLDNNVFSLVGTRLLNIKEGQDVINEEILLIVQKTITEADVLWLSWRDGNKVDMVDKVSWEVVNVKNKKVTITICGTFIRTVTDLVINLMGSIFSCDFQVVKTEKGDLGILIVY